MRQQNSNTSEQIVRHFTLLELLDRLLDKGAMVKGEVLLSVADIDLVYLNLGLLLSSVKSVMAAADKEEATPWHPFSPRDDALSAEPESETSRNDVAPLIDTGDQSYSAQREAPARPVPAISDCEPDQYFAPKASIDAKNVEKGLARLVLTLIDLIRKLMEKQAIRRIDAGQLHAEEIERVGDTFFQLDERMEQLKKTFGLHDEDLNLDLGPLGDLL
jgi:Gas vesicle protein K/Gas vesicle protein